MIIDIITLFPEMFTGPFDTSMLKKAKDIGVVQINIHNLRNWTTDRRRTVDDRPYGGGKGMIIRINIIYSALKNIKTKENKDKKIQTVLLSPQGKVFNQQKAIEFSKLDHLILISGHYEGFDERIADHLADEEISIGDYILTGGEIPAMVVVDSTVRLLKGVLEEEVTSHESFSSYYRATVHGNNTNFLDHPAYTRPEKFLNWKVPKVLLSGNHKEIEKWRREMALAKTKKNRPDLLNLT